MSETSTVYHLVRPENWVGAGDYAPASLEAEGFIHFSTREQVAGSANRFFRSARELLVVEVDPSLLDAELRYELADGQSFPHLYGPLNPSAVVSIHTLHRAPNSPFRF